MVQCIRPYISTYISAGAVDGAFVVVVVVLGPTRTIAPKYHTTQHRARTETGRLDGHSGPAR